MTPKVHGTRWKQEEIDFIKESIKDNKPLEEIVLTISLRTPAAILTKVNSLGYGNYTNKTDGLIYFKDNINHKNRSCKNKSIPTKQDVGTVDTTSKKATDSVPQIQIDITDLEEIIALHKKIITPHLNIIEKLEKIKGTS